MPRSNPGHFSFLGRLLLQEERPNLCGEGFGCHQDRRVVQTLDGAVFAVGQQRNLGFGARVKEGFALATHRY
jgi:hypothetical protein